MKKRSGKPRTVKTELDGVGMRVFVEYFDLFWDYALEREERQNVMAILLDDKVSDSPGGASWRTHCGRNIFAKDWVEEALEKILASRHIQRNSPQTITDAKKCLKEYRKAAA